MKIVIIGGHASSAKALQKTKKLYQKDHPEAEVIYYRFSYAMAHIKEVAQVCSGSYVVTHSAGCLLLKHIDRMNSLTVIAPLQSKSRRQYVVGFVRQYFKKKHHPTLLLELHKLLEIARNPFGNLRWVWNEAVGSHNFESELPEIIRKTTQTRIVLYKKDKVFSLEDYPVKAFKDIGAEVLIVAGGHDTFYFDVQKITKH